MDYGLQIQCICFALALRGSSWTMDCRYSVSALLRLCEAHPLQSAGICFGARPARIVPFGLVRC